MTTPLQHWPTDVAPINLDALPRQVRQFVAFLISKRGNPVHSGKIASHLWPDFPFTPENINEKVRKEAQRARRHLGDTNKTLIVRVYGYGYRWGGPLDTEVVKQ